MTNKLMLFVATAVNMVYNQKDQTIFTTTGTLTAIVCDYICFDALPIGNAAFPSSHKKMVDLTGIEPATSCLQSRRSPN